MSKTRVSASSLVSEEPNQAGIGLGFKDLTVLPTRHLNLCSFKFAKRGLFYLKGICVSLRFRAIQ